MAKGQKRSNREMKKPKAAQAKTPQAAPMRGALAPISAPQASGRRDRKG